MNNTKKKLISMFMLTALFISSCTDDLNTEPEIQQTLSNVLEQDPDAIKGLLAKVYGNLTLNGAGNPESNQVNPDFSAAPDPNETVFLRAHWNMQEMTTDIVKNRWGDGGLDPLTTTAGWAATNKFFQYMYDRLYLLIATANNFIVETADLDFEEKASMRGEARFLRAFAYANAMDFFGGVPLVTELDVIGGDSKPRSTREAIFNYVESELLGIREDIPVSNEYGRINRAAVDMLLAKIYLNSEVYTGTMRYDKALASTEAVINDSPFSLDDNYQSIFQGDNFTSPEIIFPFIGDRNFARSFGNTTYIVNGSGSTETMDISLNGAQNGWTGHRTTKALYGLFGPLNDDSVDTSIDDTDGNEDKRAIFHSRGHNFEMNDYKQWSDGYPTTKFRNTYAEGTAPVMNFSDTDFPMFRLADAYLMYAEAHLRNGGGSAATALDLVNQLRQRAYGDASGNISASELTLEFIIDERARELYYEGHRRQDLIRFGRFTGGTYIWPWKGGIDSGTSIPATYKLFPIPLTALQANSKLEQNPGY